MSSHSVTLHRILRVREVAAQVAEVPAYAVEGTPGDCVILGLGAIARETELVIAGINEGANLGDDVFISGTVGAAYWAARLGRTDLVGYQASARGGFVHARLRGERALLSGAAVTPSR